jgi:hypothetical protein
MTQGPIRNPNVTQPTTRHDHSRAALRPTQLKHVPFALIDVNHAGHAALVMLPGLTEEHAERVLSAEPAEVASSPSRTS